MNKTCDTSHQKSVFTMETRCCLNVLPAGTAQYIPLNYGKSVYLARSGINTELEYLQTQIEARSIIRSNEPVNLLFGFNYRRHYGPRRVCWTY